MSGTQFALSVVIPFACRILQCLDAFFRTETCLLVTRMQKEPQFNTRIGTNHCSVAFIQFDIYFRNVTVVHQERLDAVSWRDLFFPDFTANKCVRNGLALADRHNPNRRSITLTQFLNVAFFRWTLAKNEERLLHLFRGSFFSTSWHGLPLRKHSLQAFNSRRDNGYRIEAALPVSFLGIHIFPKVLVIV